MRYFILFILFSPFTGLSRDKERGYGFMASIFVFAAMITEDHQECTSHIAYFRVMAFSGQISWQQKQVMHASGSTWGRSSCRDKADTGH